MRKKRVQKATCNRFIWKRVKTIYPSIAYWFIRHSLLSWLNFLIPYAVLANIFVIVMFCCATDRFWLTHQITATTSAIPNQRDYGQRQRILINIQFKVSFFSGIQADSLRFAEYVNIGPIDRMSVSGNFLIQYYNLSIYIYNSYIRPFFLYRLVRFHI